MDREATKTDAALEPPREVETLWASKVERAKQARKVAAELRKGKLTVFPTNWSPPQAKP